ncbi:MFS transporter [Pelistega sp. NLN82]|uniref:MFS transporter n=2 Tax=Pelistega ratti TaxID=2652177 RepID=A0A6L9Y702_9BURK|nr:MFS transporter [Pelistega ratti]NEN75647.1 MFS transporter [Pelistega ratti]
MSLRTQIDQSPMTRYQWMVVGLAILLNFLDGYDVLAISFTAKSISTDLQLNFDQIGTLMSAGFIGMALGSLLFSPFADKYGRRPLLIFSTFLASLGMLMVCFSSQLNYLILWRIVTGLGVGGILPCINVIVSEYTNKKWRGLSISAYVAGFGIGASLGGMTAILLQEIYGWRSVFLVGAILTGLSALLLYFVLPESVDYLHTQKDASSKAKLRTITQHIRQPWHDALDELPIQHTTERQASLFEFFTFNHIKKYIFIWIPFFGVMASFYFISSWTPALLETAGLSKALSQTVGIAIALGGTAGSLLFGWIVSRYATRFLLIIFMILFGISTILFVLTESLSIAIILAILIGGLMNGCIAGLFTLNPSLYPVYFRSTGSGVAISLGRIGAIISPIIAGELLLNGWSKEELYFSVGIILFLTCPTLFFLKEYTEE